MDFITPQDVAAHLRFLGANRTYVNNCLAKNRLVHIVQGKPCPTIAGQLFFRRCVYRFTLWVVKVLRPKYQSSGPNQGLRDCELPPFDVLLLLHSYMLHPRPFYEDTVRLYPELAALNGFPLLQIATFIDDSMDYVPPRDQIAFWETSTGEKFASPLVTTEVDVLDLTCPSCSHSFKVSWLAGSSNGLGTDISTFCTRCKLRITDQSISVSNFLKDIRRSTSGRGVGVAGTILSNRGVVDLQGSAVLTSKIAAVAGFERLEKMRLQEVTEYLQTQSEKIFKDVNVEFMNRYGHPGGFSLDLGDAVLRQTRFASCMFHAGWTNPSFPTNGADTIEESLSRYSKFLEFIQSGEGGTIGPTKEIDLCWHTHQLSANYRNDCMRYLGYFVDHVDDSPQEHLRQSHQNAVDIWERKVGTPYDGYFKTKEFQVVVV